MPMTLREFAKNRLETLNDWQSQAVAMIDNGEPVVIVNPNQTGVTYFTQLVSRWKEHLADERRRESADVSYIGRGQIRCHPNTVTMVCKKCGWVKRVDTNA